ncbi:MAG: type II secretion system F family protein [Acidobacteria bacterium]|nr:type II secretion system F family protein [Acidobacteriota bacterium]MBV9188798.1 type II secretion system F family protein [Acidobacteriota bacterium]
MSTLSMWVVIVAAVLVASFVLLRFLRTRQDSRDDAEHLGRLLGRTTATASKNDDAPQPGAIRRRLIAAGWNTTPAIAISSLVLIGFLVALLVASVSPGLFWAGPVAGIAVAWLISSTSSEIARQRAWKFENRLVDAIDLTVGALAAGQTPADAIASGAGGALEPVRSELRHLADQLNASVPVDRAVRRMVLRYDSEGVRIFTQLLIAKWEIGGPLGPALQAATRTMRHGLRLRGQLHTHISGAQTAAIVVAILPYLLVAVFLWKRPEALALVWRLRWGPQMFASAIFLQLAGFVWLRRILRIEL